jgi:hypothetical protein
LNLKNLILIPNSNLQIKNIQNMVILNSFYNINNYSFDNLDQIINNDRLLDIKRMPSQYYFKILLKNNFDILKKIENSCVLKWLSCLSSRFFKQKQYFNKVPGSSLDEHKFFLNFGLRNFFIFLQKFFFQFFYAIKSRY